MTLKFAKFHGNGNDFVLIDEYSERKIRENRKSSFSKILCSRRFGIGADGVIFLQKNSKLKMRLFNPDGSEGEMCGSGMRCFVKYVLDKGYVSSPEIKISTLAGEFTAKLYPKGRTNWIEVNMGKPKFSCAEIPAEDEGEFKQEINGFTVYACNTGVPHAVIFVEDLGKIDINKVAPQIRHSDFFPQGANVNFVELHGKKIKIRTYERGVERETYSCGTGATASAAIAHKNYCMERKIDVKTIGGPLKIILDEDVKMIGPAEKVFIGEIEREKLWESCYHQKLPIEL